MQKKFFFLVLMIMSGITRTVYAESVRIEFSGFFSDDCFFSCTQDMQRLFGKPFRGVVEIVDDGEPLTPEVLTPVFPGGETVRYTFNTPSFMSLSTGISGFDLFERAPVNLTINNCIGGLCTFVDDSLEIVVVDDRYNYGLVLAAPEPIFESTLIPSIGQLRSMRVSSFGILNNIQTEFVFSEGDNLSEIKFSEEIKGADMLERFDDDSLLFLLPSILSGIKKNSSTKKSNKVN